jgi:hypothetical protein
MSSPTDPTSSYDLQRPGASPQQPDVGRLPDQTSQGDQSSGGGVPERAAVAAEKATEVAGEARQGAADVVQEAKEQARDLVAEARQELGQKAEQEVHHLAGGMEHLSEELRAMADARPESTAAQAVRQAADALDRTARQLQEGGLEAPTRQLKTYARRNPGRFLAYAFAAGMVSGRLTRNLASGGNGHDDDQRRTQLQGRVEPYTEAEPYTAPDAYAGAVPVSAGATAPTAVGTPYGNPDPLQGGPNTGLA